MFRTGGLRSLAKARHPFALFSTPLTYALRPFSSIRHLARSPSFTIDMKELFQRWETFQKENSTQNIRSICTSLHRLYQQRNEHQKTKHLNELFPLKDEYLKNQSLNDLMSQLDRNTLEHNEENISIRYPKLHNDLSDFYLSFVQSNSSIVKKRPYEFNEG